MQLVQALALHTACLCTPPYCYRAVLEAWVPSAPLPDAYVGIEPLLQVDVAGYGAARAIAKVARIDLLAGQWPDLLERIHTYVAPTSAEKTREHALQCLGLVCEEHVESASEFPQNETNRILTALVGGMGANQPDAIRLAATRALFDAIEFASANFDKENERNYLMQTMCEAMICGNERIRFAAYQNVNKVLELHYQYLERYIEALYGLTTAAFKDKSEDVAMQVRPMPVQRRLQAALCIYGSVALLQQSSM